MWKDRPKDADLSAYLDGELSPHQAAQIGESLVFEPGCREKLQAYTRLTDLLEAAISPPNPPDPTAFVNRLTAQLDHPPDPAPAPSKLRPAVLASVGILVTAGLTFAGWRWGTSTRWRILR